MPRPVVTGQDLLPGRADLKQAFDLIGIQLDRSAPEDFARVILGLEQTR
jgi:hypothetical protein